MSANEDIDLWPEGRFQTELVTPLSILKRQASLLGEKTSQLVTAQVLTMSPASNQLTHYFRLVVPPLDNYNYELFQVSHKIEELYPVMGYFDGRYTKIENEPDLKSWLRNVLGADSTRRKIDSLMAQAKS
jgi:hypothetical protein